MREVSSADFLKRILLVFAIVVLALAIWRVANVALLIFGGVLFAIFLRHLARSLCAYVPLPTEVAVVLVVLLLLAAIGLVGWLVGPQITAQMDRLWQQLPGGLDQVQQTLRQYSWGRFLLENAPDLGDSGSGSPNIFSTITGTVSLVFGLITNAILVLVLGLFIAANPPLYRRGIVQLVPPHRRERAREVLTTAGHALWYWLLGQLIAMLAVGIMTTVGLLLLGIPMALALGLIAGLLDFIPFVGPVLAAIPIILIAFTQGATDALYAGLLILAIQQIEGNLLMPLVQKHAVSLPPAVAVASVVLFGVLFGPVGILLATPLAVLLIVLVKMIYVEDVLGDHVKVPGREPET